MIKIIENVDYYIENNKYVFTAHFLLRRGYCCKNNCRHCPYKENARVSQLAEESVLEIDS
jgi:Family of unknown function (DUF5522)